MGVPYPGPQIHYCARCNADQWHNITPGYEPSFTCQVCGHPSDSTSNCLHSPACVVDPATRSANTGGAIRPGMSRPGPQGRNSTLRWAIPAGLAVVLVVVICGCLGFIALSRHGNSSGTANGTGNTGSGSHATAPSRQCVLAYGEVETCASSNPAVGIAAVWQGDTSSCVFAFMIDWSDGSPAKDVSVRGGDDDKTIVASHLYTKPGTYAIVAETTVISGACSGIEGQYQFTYSPS